MVAGGPEGVKTYVYGADPSAAGTGPAVVPFANAYAASTDNPGGTAAQVTATKALTGRPLSAGEFTFAVKYVTGGDDLRTAENAADGTVTFDGLHYTTEMLEGLVKDGNAYKTSDQGDHFMDGELPGVREDRRPGLPGRHAADAADLVHGDGRG